MSTPILPFAVWASGTNQNSIPANDNSLRNQILNGNVISQAVTAQPGSPADGDIYIIAATHTGAAWAGFTPKDLAIYRVINSVGAWYAFAPVEGVVVNVAGTLYKYAAGAWTAAGGSSGGAGIPVNPQSGAYTLVLGDANGAIYHPSADTTARTWTIPANSSVVFPVGTAVTFDNDIGAGAITIAITTDTLVLVGVAGSTGSRTLASGGQATAIKVTSTRWRVSGVGLS